jgi:hypothetical protein
MIMIFKDLSLIDSYKSNYKCEDAVSWIRFKITQQQYGKGEVNMKQD